MMVTMIIPILALSFLPWLLPLSGCGYCAQQAMSCPSEQAASSTDIFGDNGSSSTLDVCTTSAEILRHVMSVVDMAPSTPPAPPCDRCKSAWFCTCRTKDDASPWHHLRRLHKTRRCTVVCPSAQPLDDGSYSIPHAKRPRCERHVLENPRLQPGPMSNTEAEPNMHPKAQEPKFSSSPVIPVAVQTTWEAAQEKLNEKTWRMPSCRQNLDKLFGDCAMLVQLADSTDYIGHGERLLDLIPKNLCFKIGMACDPHHRFYYASYAYTRLGLQRQDSCEYHTMSILNCNKNQQVIAMYEHYLIKRALKTYGKRCRNVRSDLDDYKRFQADSGDEAVADQVWFCYVVLGPPLHGCI